jgi:hypothetical protein
MKTYVFYHTPTRSYLKFEGSMEECKKYLKENKLSIKEHNQGYFLSIRDFNNTCILTDSQI